MANESTHTRDLGYLDRFIQKLEEQAQGLPDGPRQEALGLLGEQRSQWATIMGLLSGATPESPAEAPASAPSPTAAEAAPILTASRPAGHGGLTVGSLIGYP